MGNFYDFEPPEPELRPRDSKVDEAKEFLSRFFDENQKTVFYEHQIEVMHEKRFFHWITGKALHELDAEEKIASELVPLAGEVQIRFYRRKSHRNWKRQAKEILKLVNNFSNEDFARGLGRHGEQMFDAALPRIGFIPKGKNVRTYNDRTWEETGHDLDRVFEHGGVAYGTEIKNRLSYMDLEDIEIKISMCDFLGIIPLFIVRMFPKSYFDFIYRRGGVTLIFEYQLYPHGQHHFAREVHDQLRLPVDCPAAIYDGTLTRLLRAIAPRRARQTISYSYREPATYCPARTSSIPFADSSQNQQSPAAVGATPYPCEADA